MLNTLIHPTKVLHHTLGWLMNAIVQDVPEPIALCEFDCRKSQCTFDQWASCERRLKRAAGELRPTPASADH